MEPLSNSRIALSSFNETIKVWGEEEGRPISYYLYLDSKVVSFCYIRKHNMLIALSQSNKIYTWNGSTFQIISIITRIDSSYGNIFQLDNETIIMKKDSTFLMIDVIKCTRTKREIFDINGILTGVIKINDENILVGTNVGLYMMNSRKKSENFYFNEINQILKIKNNLFALLTRNEIFIEEYQIKKT